MWWGLVRRPAEGESLPRRRSPPSSLLVESTDGNCSRSPPGVDPGRRHPPSSPWAAIPLPWLRRRSSFPDEGGRRDPPPFSQARPRCPSASSRGDCRFPSSATSFGFAVAACFHACLLSGVGGHGMRRSLSQWVAASGILLAGEVRLQCGARWAAVAGADPRRRERQLPHWCGEGCGDTAGPLAIVAFSQHGVLQMGIGYIAGVSLRSQRLPSSAPLSLSFPLLGLVFATGGALQIQLFTNCSYFSLQVVEIV
jgi:hypothetical protein